MVRKTIFVTLLTAALLCPTLTWAAATTSAPTQIPTLTLEKCLELAYANNQQLKTATQSVVIAKENVKKAQGGFLPTLDYQIASTKSSHPDAVIDPVYSGSLSASYSIYTGGKLTSILKIAQYQLDLAKEKERNAKQKLTCNVKTAYNNLWLAAEQLIVANASYENMTHHAERIEKLYSVGNTSKFELLRAQVQRDNLKPNVIKAQNGISIAKLALGTLIGIKKQSEVNIAFDPDKIKLPDNPNDSLDPTLNAAYQNRSELKQLQLTAQISDVQVDLAKVNYKPKADLSASYQGVGAELNPDSWQKEWTLTLGVKGNLFNGANAPALNAAKGDVALQKIQEDALKDSIRQEIEQVLQSIKESLETAKSTQSSIALAQESLRLTEVRFQAGMATTMDVMDAQLALDQALNGYYRSVAAYLNAEAQLELATGN